MGNTGCAEALRRDSLGGFGLGVDVEETLSCSPRAELSLIV